MKNSNNTLQSLFPQKKFSEVLKTVSIISKEKAAEFLKDAIYDTEDVAKRCGYENVTSDLIAAHLLSRTKIYTTLLLKIIGEDLLGNIEFDLDAIRKYFSEIAGRV